MQNKNINYGIGAIGHLKNEMNEKKFLAYVKSSLKCSSFRYAKGKEKIKTVAVCGGSGGDLLNKSIAVGADAFITADLKYHQFQEAENKILLIDAGHFETEIFGVKVLKEKIENYLKDNKGTSVFEFKGSTNPVKFYKQ
jgi:putative NIF3 family GTP cyclohydrolase 1 type 2